MREEERNVTALIPSVWYGHKPHWKAHERHLTYFGNWFQMSNGDPHARTRQGGGLHVEGQASNARIRDAP